MATALIASALLVGCGGDDGGAAGVGGGGDFIPDEGDISGDAPPTLAMAIEAVGLLNEGRHDEACPMVFGPEEEEGFFDTEEEDPDAPTDQEICHNDYPWVYEEGEWRVVGYYAGGDRETVIARGDDLCILVEDDHDWDSVDPEGPSCTGTGDEGWVPLNE